MKLHFGILFLLVSLFALPANKATACGSHAAGHAEKFHKETLQKSCCSKDKAKAHNAVASSSNDADCPCDQDKGGCHCPGCGMVCHAGSAFTVDLSLELSVYPIQNDSVQKRAFYFAQHMPEDVYLSIWQPPKIGA